MDGHREYTVRVKHNIYAKTPSPPTDKSHLKVEGRRKDEAEDDETKVVICLCTNRLSQTPRRRDGTTARRHITCTQYEYCTDRASSTVVSLYLLHLSLRNPRRVTHAPAAPSSALLVRLRERPGTLLRGVRIQSLQHRR